MALIGEMRFLQIGGNTYEIPTSELPIASSSTLGGIKVGNNLSIDSSTGVLSASFTETDPIFSASAAAGITATDITNWDNKVSDTGKWNNVSLTKTNQTSQLGGSDIYIPYIMSTSGTEAKLVLAGNGRVANSIATYNVNGYLISTTPGASDSSTKVATTAWVTGKGYLTSYTETDPTVPSWAKAESKPSYTASEVGAVAKTGDTMTGQLIVPHDTNAEKGGICFDNANAYPDITIVGGGGYHDSSYDTDYPYLSFYYGISTSNKVILNNIAIPREDYNAANKLYVDNKFSSISFPVTSVNTKTGAITLSASDVGAVPQTAGDSDVFHASSIQGVGLILYKDSIKFQTNVGDSYPYVGISRGHTTQLNLITSESGQVILNNVATPTFNYHAANKLYVDTRSLPTGGTAGQVLKKTSSTNYAVEWGAVDALPAVTSSDNNKILMVVNGAWAAASLPTYNGGVS